MVAGNLGQALEPLDDDPIAGAMDVERHGMGHDRHADPQVAAADVAVEPIARWAPVATTANAAAASDADRTPAM